MFLKAGFQSFCHLFSDPFGRNNFNVRDEREETLKEFAIWAYADCNGVCVGIDNLL